MAPDATSTVAAASSLAAADPPSGWHFIRPWNAQLSLYVREITSVSVTFILATDLYGDIDTLDTSLATLGFNAAAENDASSNSSTTDDDDDERDRQNDDVQDQLAGTGVADETTSSTEKAQSLITETLSNGLRVNVNNVNWQRVLIRVDEKADEAVIIVYGLMPGRQYDIDLALVQPGQQGSPQQQQQIRRQIDTFEDTTSEMSFTDPDSPSYDNSNSSSSDAHHTVSTPSTSPSRTIPNTPPPPPASIPSSNSALLSSSMSTGSSSSSASTSTTSSSSTSDSSSSPPQISLEERLNQLHHSLSQINAEREALLASLKSARKDSQKADAALRSEMDALKRASEKHAAGEARARQKILALQEAVKRAQAATKETEAQVEEMESEVPVLLSQKEAKESEYKQVKEEAEKVRKVKATEMEKDKKRQEAMRSELQSLTNKLEKLTAKKERHEGATIPELEGQLGAVERDIGEQERLLMQMELNREFEDVSRIVLGSVGQHQHQPSKSSISSNSSNVTNPFSLSPPYYSNFGDHTSYDPLQRKRNHGLGATQSPGGGSNASGSGAGAAGSSMNVNVNIGSGSAGGAGAGPVGRPSHQVAPIQRPHLSSVTLPSSKSLDSTSSTGTSASGSVYAQFQQMMAAASNTSAAIGNGSTNIWNPPPLRHSSSSAGAGGVHAGTSVAGSGGGLGHVGRSNSLQYPSQKPSQSQLLLQGPPGLYRDPFFLPTSQQQQQLQQLSTSPSSSTLYFHSQLNHYQQQQQQQQQQAPMILTNPARRSGSLKVKGSASMSNSNSPPGLQRQSQDGASSSSASSSPGVGVGGAGTASGGGGSVVSPQTSTLSGRAPAFEPGKGRSFGLRISTAAVSAATGASSSGANAGSTSLVQAGSGSGNGGGGGYVVGGGGGGGTRSFGVIGMGRR